MSAATIGWQAGRRGNAIGWVVAVLVALVAGAALGWYVRDRWQGHPTSTLVTVPIAVPSPAQGGPRLVHAIYRSTSDLDGGGRREDTRSMTLVGCTDEGGTHVLTVDEIAASHVRECGARS